MSRIRLPRSALLETQTQHNNRRHFLKCMGGGLASAAAWSTLAQLGMMQSAAAQATTGYKALVCIYLAGANDSFNWLAPRDSVTTGSRYDAYQIARGGVYGAGNSQGLAIPFSDLLPISPSNQAIEYGLHPAHVDFQTATQSHSGLKSIFAAGKAAFICNVGPLVEPLSKASYLTNGRKPAQLFSHNDQENFWHLGFADNTLPLSRTGWGGRLAQSLGGNLANGLSPAISISGSARFLTGSQIVPYQLAASGVDVLDNYGASASTNYQSARRSVLNDLLAQSSDSPFVREYTRTFSRSLSIGESLSTILAGTDGTIATEFPAGSLSDQLKLVARMIKASRNSLGASRQVFYVRLGGFDLHDGMFVNGQPIATTGHGELLTQLNQGLGAFWTALEEIGARSQVTSFTMSDFGRTLSGNGNGTDHAWGGNMMVMGDAVLGGKLYGRYPQLILDNDDASNQDYSLSRGQYIPTTAVEQVAATLARWMGITDSSALDAMFPLLGNFSSSDLGFMST
jgi:uncharacterized protein (DUF1501 family)